MECALEEKYIDEYYGFLIKNQEKRVSHLKNGEGYAILEKGFQSREKHRKNVKKITKKT